MKHPTDTPRPFARTPHSGESSVQLMVVDSDFALALWELTGTDAADAHRQLEPFANGGEFVLRVRGWREGSPSRSWDIPIARWNDTRYVPLAEGVSFHQVTLGLRANDVDLLIPIVRSEVVDLGRPAPNEPLVWADVPAARQ